MTQTQRQRNQSVPDVVSGLRGPRELFTPVGAPQPSRDVDYDRVLPTIPLDDFEQYLAESARQVEAAEPEKVVHEFHSEIRRHMILLSSTHVQGNATVVVDGKVLGTTHSQIKFEDGIFRTDDQALAAKIRNSPAFKEGKIWDAKERKRHHDAVQMAGFVNAMERRPDLVGVVLRRLKASGAIKDFIVEPLESDQPPSSPRIPTVPVSPAVPAASTPSAQGVSPTP